MSTARTRRGKSPSEMAANPETTASTDSEQLSLAAFTNAITTLKEDICTKIDTVATNLKAEISAVREEMRTSIASLQTVSDKHGAQLAELEKAAGFSGDVLSELQVKVNRLTDLVSNLQDKCEDLESRSRRNNIRLVNIPEGLEGNRATEFISELLRDLLQLDETPLIDRAHRTLRAKPKDDEPPRPFVVRLHYFQVKERILQQAARLGPLLYREKRVSVFPDLTAAVSKKRAAFTGVKRLFRNIPGIKYGKKEMAESSSPQPRQDRSQICPGSSSPLCEDQFQCSICLDVFTDPVSTPCGHNFCKTCITQYWNTTQHCNCPFCKEKFTKRPELKINTTLREVADHFKKKSVLDKPEILCDVCTKEKGKAFKSCLNCGATFCKTHLELHTVGTLKNHKLIDPVENLEDYICQKHERPLELFCRDDQMCVCQFCTETDHKNHSTVPIEKESGEIKTLLEKTQTDIQQMIQGKLKKIKGIKHSVEIRKRNTEKEISDSAEVFTALIHSIERSQADLLEVMEEKQKAAEKQAEEFIKELEQEITELKRRDMKLEQLLNTEDHLHLLQNYPSLCRPTHTTNCTDISFEPHLSVETVRNVLSQLQKSLEEELTKRLKETVSTELKRIQEYAVDVTLDPDTAQPYLNLSDDGKQVTDEDTKQNLPDNPKRFNFGPCVLGKEGFSSGRFYYEVQVSGKTKWDLGVARESINRKGSITLSPQDGFWTVWLRNGNKYMALAETRVLLSVGEKLQKVGVFVDYEEGLVSFYNVEERSHIYSFTGQSFTEKLYPFFAPCNNDEGKNSAPLIISPVCKNK